MSAEREKQPLMDSSRLRRGVSLPWMSPTGSTLWSGEKPSRDSRLSDDKPVNVKVVLRCRPPSEDEVRAKAPLVISCDEEKQEVSAILNTNAKQTNRTFVFDKVFGPSTQQKDLYNQAVAPLVDDALEGYSCTVFAYGQTGTGKTYTMEGEGGKEKNGEFHKNAGVIPRAVEQIFNSLESEKAEYMMKVTFIELYNEEITDLLSAEEDSRSFSDEKQLKAVKLMEDGKSAVFIKGLQEEIVSSADEIYRILERGSAKKHTAETLLNKQSNRSHSIFSITVQIKECVSEGVELIKCGKLNLVDLAGSENILRSGAKEGRAREAGEINKSLLTLGRVINALADHSGHVPYRDSKLTRLLKDSLGGKTKTCIIATVSPSLQCLDETLSTLDYAFRAKIIKNRPEVNQKIVKSAFIKDIYVEMDRLKQELLATREKNGIYIPRDRYQSDEAAQKAMAEKLRLMELDLELKNKKIVELEDLYSNQQKLTADLGEKLGMAKTELKKTEQSLSEVEAQYSQAKETIRQKQYLVFNLITSEKALTEKAIELRAELENAESEVSRLCSEIENNNLREQRNRVLLQNFQNQLAQQLELLKTGVAASVSQEAQQLKAVQENTKVFLSAKSKATEDFQNLLQKLKEVYVFDVQNLADIAEEHCKNCQLAFGKFTSEVSKHSSSIMDLVGKISSDIVSILNGLEHNLNGLEVKMKAFLQQEQQNQSRTYQATNLISEVLLSFFKNLNTSVSNLAHMEEESKRKNSQQICDIRTKFEELAANEEREILEQVALLLASSNARKKHLVQTELDALERSANSRTSNLNQEFSKIQDCTCSTQDEWASFIEATHAHRIQDSTILETWKGGLEESLRCCVKNSNAVEEQWRNAQESLICQHTRNTNTIDSIVKSEMARNEQVHARVSACVSFILEETDLANKNLLSSTEYLMKLDHGECEKIKTCVDPCIDDINAMEMTHSHKISEIASNAERVFTDDYKVSETLDSTPRRIKFNLPSKEFIENLRTPSLELLKSFQEGGIGDQANGDVNIKSESHKIAQMDAGFFSL
nr:kinesin-like protein KIN-5D [Ipomoea trifida]